jgi:protein-L-isoaspartate(D-aspartate) O-methyltransferase
LKRLGLWLSAGVLGLALLGLDAAQQGERGSERVAMVERQIAARGITEPRLLEALRTVPRHRFVPPAMQREAYTDGPLPIGEGQTISQPFIVAAMTDALHLQPSDRVYELGTGSGYQAAVASRLCTHVYTVEIQPALAARAARTLAELGYTNVSVRSGDGFRGWPEAAPFDAMLITAAVAELPGALLAQLKPGGRAVLPLGPLRGVQELIVVEKSLDGRTTTRELFPVRFVPSTGQP